MKHAMIGVQSSWKRGFAIRASIAESKFAEFLGHKFLSPIIRAAWILRSLRSSLARRSEFSQKMQTVIFFANDPITLAGCFFQGFSVSKVNVSPCVLDATGLLKNSRGQGD